MHQNEYLWRKGLTLSQTTKFLTLPNWKTLQMTISNLMKMEESSSNRYKTLWEKEKLLVTSNFSFSHNVFKRLILQACKNQGLFGQGLSILLPEHGPNGCLCFLIVFLMTLRLISRLISLNHSTNLRHIQIQPFPKQQILDSSKLKEFGNNNFKFRDNVAKAFHMDRKWYGKKEKLLITSNFFFSYTWHSVFKILVL